MTLIDQRIVIDAPPHVVWNHIADPNEVRRWHAGYRNISVLTTRQTGMGTRRRCSLADGGKDVIEEITAWVEGLGYEYTQVEGGSYRSLRARIRLQAGPDGTIVQWTVTYKPRGVLGTVRNMFGGKREMQTMMAESLRALRRQIDELGLRMDAQYRERVSMRGRLNHDERQQYVQRQGEPGEGDLPVELETLAPQPVLPQPMPPQPVTPPPVVTPPAPVQVTPPPMREEAIPAAPEKPVVPSPAVRPPAITPVRGMPPVVVESTAPVMPAVPDELEAVASGIEAEAEFDTAVPSFVSDLLREAGDPLDTDIDYSSHTADTDPKPPAGLREAFSSDADQQVQQATQDLIHPSVLPSVLPVAPRPASEVAPATSKAPTRPLDPNKAALVDVPGAQDLPARAGTDPHSRPTPPRGMPSVRSQMTVDAVPVIPEEPPAPEAPKLLAASAPTPARGIPAVRPAPPPVDNALSERVPSGHLPPPTPKTDTGEMSIWEVFGAPRPSEQDAHALQDLIESVNAREAAQVRRRSRWAKRPARVRYVQLAVGLRTRIGQQQAHVRVHRVRRPSSGD